MDRISLDDLFDRRLDFPDMSARKRFTRLVGVDEAKSRLSKLLGILINPAGPRDWADKIPAESVYAIFEAKQTINADLIKYAQEKVASVRALHRTSLPIPHAGGEYPAKVPGHILGGILTFDSDWSPPLGDPLRKALAAGNTEQQMDLGCVAAHGTFFRQNDGSYLVTEHGKPATAFLLELIARLQSLATVPMIDVRAYAGWLI
jgi:hypothetical protein